MKHVLCLIFLSFAGFAPADDKQATRPNVVILLTGDQGTLDANCYGSNGLVTPNMDKLAATGKEDGHEPIAARQEWGGSTIQPCGC